MTLTALTARLLPGIVLAGSAWAGQAPGQIVQSDAPAERRYLVIAPGTPDKPGAPTQVQIQ